MKELQGVSEFNERLMINSLKWEIKINHFKRTCHVTINTLENEHANVLLTSYLKISGGTSRKYIRSKKFGSQKQNK